MLKAPELTGKSLALLFFNQNHRDKDIWTSQPCEKGVEKAAYGYSNLRTHIRIHHQDEIFNYFNRSKKGRISLFVDTIAVRMLLTSTVNVR